MHNSRRYLRQRYELQSMAHLRAEREKLRWRIHTAEERLEADYLRVSDMLSFANVARMAFSKIENIQVLVEGLRNSYRSVSALFRRRKE